MPKPKVIHQKRKMIYIEIEGKKVLCQSSALKSIYKFFGEPLQNSNSRENLKSLLLDNKLRLTGPKEVNDPFDCNPNYIDNQKGNKAAAAIGLMLNRPSTSEAFKSFQEEMRVRFPNRKSRRRDKDFQAFVRESGNRAFKQFYGEHGFASFTEDGGNPLLWAHYSSSHKGVAIEFSTKPSTSTGNAVILPIGSQLVEVKYTDLRPKILSSDLAKTIAKKSDPHPSLVDGILKKAKCWSYEKEWRFVGRVDTNYSEPKTGDLVDIGEQAIQAIILGSKSSDETELFIKNLISQSRQKIKLKKATLAHRHFDINIS